MEHKLKELNYKLDDLEPIIDKSIMDLHYNKHYAGYVAALNKAITDSKKLQNLSLLEILPEIKNLPKDSQGAFRNNAGGACNHELYWDILTPGGPKTPQGDLSKEINKTFGNLDNLISIINDSGMKRFGSGWAWLVWNNGLEVCSTANQDSPLMGKEISGCEGIPLIGIDVWEHAYYLQYMNRRAEYLNNIWQLINWDKVEALFRAAKS